MKAGLEVHRLVSFRQKEEVIPCRGNEDSVNQRQSGKYDRVCQVEDSHRDKTEHRVILLADASSPVNH